VKKGWPLTGFRSGCKIVCLDEKGFIVNDLSPPKEEAMAMKNSFDGELV
jgi:hypothetical protein